MVEYVINFRGICMCDTGYDIEKTKDVFFLFDNGYHQYDKVYASSNDSYQNIISDFDIKDKRVLSVLGSGDQALHLYRSGAKVVDVFDINKLTIYYYFLRIWTVKYLEMAYPPYLFDNKYLAGLLGWVSPTSSLEKSAYDYWNMYVKTYDSDCNYKLFTHFMIPQERYSQDVSDLKDKINDDFSFYNIDITKSVEIDQKYDVIYTSNIAEFIHDMESFKIYRDNLDKLLEKDGVILSSRLMRAITSKNERKIMGKCFKYKCLPAKVNEFGFEVDPGYCYTKRRFKRLF